MRDREAPGDAEASILPLPLRGPVALRRELLQGSVLVSPLLIHRYAAVTAVFTAVAAASAVLAPRAPACPGLDMFLGRVGSFGVAIRSRPAPRIGGFRRVAGAAPADAGTNFII
eukprot:CAMPEP_0167771070 /NCGR_PEP_ID=MMETSP0111_2-20121227/67_1 /TAXON_ID=91324 /ORGANISM="Lotharella globosa, Strain CCCM811" /LENGTH=113 /DNA_ID=CAMNT_0007660369 /DNA_START=981 /DNA_END=1322 /DNA_ORIENTATION=-